VVFLHGHPNSSVSRPPAMQLRSSFEGQCFVAGFVLKQHHGRNDQQHIMTAARHTVNFDVIFNSVQPRL